MIYSQFYFCFSEKRTNSIRTIFTHWINRSPYNVNHSHTGATQGI